MRRPWLVHLWLAAATLAVYAQAVSFEFVDFDDGEYVTEVEAVRRGLAWQGARWAFSSQHGVVWQPVTWLSHMADFELFGANPAGHHATSVLLHLANALLLFELLRRLTRESGPSAFAAALFALHPLHVESVAWVAERKEVLATAFGLLALLAYAGWARRGGAARYAAAAACLALGLMAKPTLVTLPCIMLLLDHWPLRRLEAAADLGHRLAEKLPLLLLSASAALVTLTTQRAAMQAGSALSLGQKLANACLAYAVYLRRFLLPSDLAAHYPHPWIPETGGSPTAAWVVLACAGLLLAASWLALRPQAARWARVGWLWYLGTLVPMLGLVQVGAQGMADRYTYVPLIGVAILVAWGGRDLLRRLSPRADRLGAVAAVAACSACALLAFGQARTWRDSVALFERALSVHPRNSLMNVNLGKAYESQGRLEEAARHYRAALEVNPRSRAAHFNLGNTLRVAGDLGAAARHYRSALALAPEDPRVLGNLAGVLWLQGDTAEAVALWRRTLEVRPDDPVALRSLASVGRAAGASAALSP